MRQQAYGALLSYLSIFINMAIALAFTPFLVEHLGKTQYGLFNIVGSFAAYLIVLDMGLNDAVIRYLIKHQKNNRSKIEKNFLANVFIFYMLLGFFVLLAGGILFYSLDNLFGKTLSFTEIHDLKMMTLIIVFNAFLTVVFNPVGAYLIAKQKFIFLNGTIILLRVFTTLMLVIILYAGYGAVAVVFVTAVLNFLYLSVKIFYAYRLGMRVKIYRFLPRQTAKLLWYSAPIFIVVLTEVIYWKLDNILLGSMIGAGVVAVYAIGMMFHKYFMSFSTAISKVMMPKIIIDMDKGADAAELERILTKISRWQAMVIFLILSGLMLYGKDFIRLWLGEHYIDAYYVMMWTLLPYAFELTGNVRNIFLQVNHLYWYRAVIVFSVSLINIFLTIYLIKIYGMIGAAISTGIAVTIGYVAVNFVLWKKLNIHVVRYLKNLLKGIMTAVSISVFIAYLFSTHIDSWKVLVLHIVVYTMVYMVMIRFVAMNKEELAGVNTILKSVTYKMSSMRRRGN
jgi:O-antigen/teichoic acid export membrane protein